MGFLSFYYVEREIFILFLFTTVVRGHVHKLKMPQLLCFIFTSHMLSCHNFVYHINSEVTILQIFINSKHLPTTTHGMMIVTCVTFRTLCEKNYESIKQQFIFPIFKMGMTILWRVSSEGIR